MNSRTRAMLAARAKDSQDKRDRALAAIASLETAGAPVTPAAVAAAAGVSTWLVYADGVREHVQAARQRQGCNAPGRPGAAVPAGGEPVTLASLRTDLGVAREQVRQLRAERDKLLGRLRLQLGAEIEGPERAELITRISQLEEPRASSQPSATPAPPRPATPSTASQNWKTSSPPPARACAAS